METQVSYVVATEEEREKLACPLRRDYCMKKLCAWWSGYEECAVLSIVTELHEMMMQRIGK
jgi:hypothetical protein